MARSKGPVLPPGGQPAQARPEPDRYPYYGAPNEPAYPQYPPARPHPQDRSHEGYSYPSQPHPQAGGYAQPDPYGHPEPSLPLPHGYPPQHEPAPAYDPRYAPQAYEPAPPQPVGRPAHPSDPAGYGQPYDPYAQHPGYQHPAAYPPQRDYAPEPPSYDVPVTEPRTFPPRQEPNLARFQDARRPPAFDPQQPDPQAYLPPEPQLRGAQYDQWAGNDPHGYDLGNYAPPGPAGGADRGRQPPAAPYPVEPLRSDQQIDQGSSALESYDDEDEEYEDDPPPRRRGRGLLVALALLGAIGLGGGLAYAYKMFFSAPTTSATRVVKAPEQPAKTQPADPGGRRFANTDSKVMERLPSDGSAAQGADAPSDEVGGARRVQIIPVGRDGTLASPPPAVAQPPSLPPSSVGVPGMTIVNTGAPFPPPAAPPPPLTVAPPQSPSQAGRVPVTPLRPQIVARAEPEEARPEPPPVQRAPPITIRAPAPPAAPAAPARDPAPPAREPEAAAVTPAAAPREPARKATNFVAVLSSQKSRVEALSVFADLQQRYSDVLADKVPDVQEADLSSRNLGTLYRLVVGPPGPRDKALGVCNELKSAGYQGCWVTAF